MKQLLDMNMEKNWELCIFFFPPWINKWKNHFSSRQFHHCWAESSSDPRRPRCFGSKDEGKRGKIYKHGIHTSYNTERNLSGDKLYFVTIFCVTPHILGELSGDTDGYTVLSTTVKTQPFNNANVRKTGRNPSRPRGTRFIMYNFHGNLAICRLWPGFVLK